MAEAKRDSNRVTTLLGVSIDDLTTPEKLAVDPDNNRLLVQPNFEVGVNFDYVGIVNTNTDEDTLTYKFGGSGGTTVRTLVITYATGVDKVSDNITSLDFS
jgi:hypothetical protein